MDKNSDFQTVLQGTPRGSPEPPSGLLGEGGVGVGEGEDGSGVD